MQKGGGRYYGEVRHLAKGVVQPMDASFCWKCQYFACGGANVAMGMAEADFHYVQGKAAYACSSFVIASALQTGVPIDIT